MSPEQHFQRFRDAIDVAALAAVFDALAPELLVVAAHLAGRDAEDLVQATFLDAIGKADRWDAERPLLPWLIGILVNHARQERRRRNRTLAAERLPARTEPSPLELLAQNELADLLTDGLRSLPRQLRETLTLRLVHGLSPAEIAHAMGCPVATTKTRLQRGLQWLRRVLPTGVGAAAVVLATAEPGLAAVRAAVLARGEALAAAATTGLASGLTGLSIRALLGGILMKKATLAVAALLGVGALFLFRTPLDPAPTTDLAPTSPTAAVATTTGPPATDSSTTAAPTGTERTSGLAEAARPGSATLEFVWRDDGSPARGLVVMLQATAENGTPVRLTSDGSGMLVLRDLAAGRHEVYGTKFHHALQVEPDRTTQERIEVEPSLRIEGIVFDREWRRIPDAVVFAQYFPDRSDTAPRRVAISGADGTFKAAADQGAYFWAQKPGHAPSPCTASLDEGTLQLLLVLGPGGGRVSGTVLAADARAVPGAQVLFVRLEPPDECAAPIVLRACADGRFATTELGRGNHLLVAQAPGHASASVPVHLDGNDQVCDIQLSLGAVVTGRILASGGAPLDAEVTLRPQWAGGQRGWIEALRPLFHLCAQHATTDATGHYRIENAPDGPATIAVDARRLAVPAAREVRLAAGGHERCDFVLQSASEIHGRLVDGHERPIAGWCVDAWPAGGGAASSAVTAADGTFLLTGLDAADGAAQSNAEYVVEARPAGLRDSLPWANATNVHPGPTELVLRATTREEDGGWFTGTLLASDGAPPRHPAKAWVIPEGQRQGTHMPIVIDEVGAFRIGPLPAARYRLGIRVEDEAAVSLGSHDLTPRQEVRLAPARLPATGVLEVRFTTPRGGVVMPAEATVLDRAGNAGTLLPHGQDGLFRSHPLPAGIYRLSAWGEDFVLTPTEVVVAADRTTASEVPVRPATRVVFAFTWSPGTGHDERRPTIVELRVHDAAAVEVAATRMLVDPTAVSTWRRGLSAGLHRFTARVGQAGDRVTGTFTVHDDAAEQTVEVVLPANTTSK